MKIEEFTNCSRYVWGLGAVGLSTLLSLRRVGRIALGIDPDVEHCRRLASGEPITRSLPSEERKVIADAVADGKMSFTSTIDSITVPSSSAHFIAVPTEQDGIPTSRFVETVCKTLATLIRDSDAKDTLIIFESTLTPGTVDRVVLPTFQQFGLQVERDYFLCVSPRRDWFSEYEDEGMDRVFGCAGPRSSAAARAALGEFAPRIHEASDYRVAELTKCAENAYRYIELSFANELSLMYPNVNIREVLQLASTKWNMGLFQPSLRIGGHCVPVAARHLQMSTVGQPSPILLSAIASDFTMIRVLAHGMKRRGVKRPLILGLAYRPGIPYLQGSGGLGLAKELSEIGIPAVLCDPVLTSEFFPAVAAWECADVDKLPDNCDCVVLATPEAVFLQDSFICAIGEKFGDKIIVDSHGAWKSSPLGSLPSYCAVGDSSFGELTREMQGVTA